MIIVGIDPGFTGAIAVLDIGTNGLVIHDCPTFAIKGKTLINIEHLATIFADLAKRDPLVILEWVGAMPRQGLGSTWKFAEGFGIYRGLCAAFRLRTEMVKPTKWKRALNLGHDKELARRVATQLFPAESQLFARVKDDGRAEAALLCVYGNISRPAPASAKAAA